MALRRSRVLEWGSEAAMQIANKFPDTSAFTPSQQGVAPDIDGQLRQQRTYHRRILLQRASGLWWPRIVLILLSAIIATILGLVVAATGQATLMQVALKCIVIVVLFVVASILVFLAARHLEFGLLLTAIVATVFVPEMFSVKSLAVYPVVPLLLVLFVVLIVQAAFRVREFVVPSFWAIWPQLGIITIAIISTIMVQITWTASVPHKINSTPIIEDELLGIGLCLIPLITITFTTMALTKKDRYVEYIQRTFLILAFIAASIVVIEFKRAGASVYTFRYSEPSIFWMKLKDLAQLINLGAMIAYARFLYATRWRTRIFYLAILALCLVGVYFTLENSWWLEIVVALIVMSFTYSRRLVIVFCIAGLPLIPVIKNEIAKIATVKTADFYRLIIWQDALRVWSKQPLLGVGPGDFWAYDQRFTQLPRIIRNCDVTGLCVAHNGFLQVLAEMGPIGLFFWLSTITLIAFIALRLVRRSPVPQKTAGGLAGFIGLNLACESENRNDRMLGLVALGLICGSAMADFFSGGFILPARQIDSFLWIPHVLTSWIIWGCVVYKDQLWRMARRGLKIEKVGSKTL
jgi:O-antigen ligase